MVVVGMAGAAIMLHRAVVNWIEVTNTQNDIIYSLNQAYSIHILVCLDAHSSAHRNFLLPSH